MQAHRSRRFHLLVASLVLMVVLACSSFLPKDDSSDPSGSIVLAADESGNFEIYHLYLGGSDPIRLTNNTSEDIAPYYIPSTQRIGYVSDKSGKYKPYTMSLIGSDEIAWKKNDSRVFGSPSISPDEKWIAFVIQLDDESSDLYIAKPDGSGEERLTRESGMDWDPSWSPDGKEIVYASDADGDWEIYVVNLESKDVVQLTDNKLYDGHPRWSPMGNRIVFDTERGGDWEIFTMDSDGKNVKAVTENSAADWMPAWSPDGQWIVYVSNRDGDAEIYIVDASGKNQSKLTNNDTQDLYPLWIP